MRGAVARIVALLSCLWLATQCAARGPAATPAQLADIARADALVRAGCYGCLQEALGIYTSLITPPARRPTDVALRGAFDVTLLLAVREKELGLPADATLARARTLAARLDSSRAGAPGRSRQPSREGRSHLDEPSLRLKIAEAIVGDLSGLDAEERQQRDDGLQQQAQTPASAPTPTSAPIQPQTRPRTPVASSPGAPGVPDVLTVPSDLTDLSDLTTAYLAVARDCEQPGNRRSIDLTAALARAGDSPLMRYRVAICSNGAPTALTPLRDADPRWVDIFFFEGRYEMGSPARPPEPVRAAALLSAASAAFPESLSMRLMLANAQEMNGDAAAALASFDRVLAARPAHVDAQLGRVRNLSYLGRADEGIAAATVLVERATWHVGDAYYWRAWNAYQARRLDPAWTDVQQAMRLLANTAVYALAGSIAYARKDLDTAVRHFDSAFAIDPSNCLAAWSAGLVQIDQAAWPPAADRFSKATSCFALAASHARTDLERLEQSASDPALKASRMANARKRIESAEDLGSQSALNAAQSFLHAGQKDRALAYIAQAQQHPATRDKARALRPRIDSLP